jgi:hypothetical protein
VRCADRPGLRSPRPKPAPAGSVVQWVISRRPLVREISVDRMSYKNASAKQTHDEHDGFSHFDASVLNTIGKRLMAGVRSPLHQPNK